MIMTPSLCSMEWPLSSRFYSMILVQFMQICSPPAKYLWNGEGHRSSKNTFDIGTGKCSTTRLAKLHGQKSLQIPSALSSPVCVSIQRNRCNLQMLKECMRNSSALTITAKPLLCLSMTFFLFNSSRAHN
jgi:hypothetical protein